MNVIIWLTVGGVLGWLASILMKTNEFQGVILNVVVAVTGALIAGYFLAPTIGTATINANDFSASSLLASFVGSVILLALVTMFRRGSIR